MPPRLNAPLMAVLAVFTLTRCASYPLLIETDPPGADIVIEDPLTGTRTVAQPYRMKMNPDVLTKIAVRPPAGEEDQFEPKRFVLSLSSYNNLPIDADGETRKLSLQLDKKKEELFVNITYVEVVLDMSRRWRGLISQSRSFKEITEVGGMTPMRVVTLDSRLGLTGLALSPDGTKIVYSLASYAVDVPTMMTTLPVDDRRIVDIKGCNLRGVSTDAGGVQQITSEDFVDMFPSFNPAGDGLLLSSNRRRPTLSDILQIPYPGRGAVSNVYINPNEAMAVKPTQAKDGTLAFTVYPDNESEPQVWTTGGKFEFPTQITKGLEPAISPDGKRIAYIGADGNLWVTDSDGSNQMQLTSSAARIVAAYYESLDETEKRLFNWSVKRRIRPLSPFSFPSWDATGRYIVYSAMEGNDNTGRPNEDIWMMTYDGQKKQQLTTNGSADRFALMSPDGRYIYFLSNRGKSWAIWRIETPPIQ